MPRKITRKGLIKKLDTVFSLYIRQRYADKNGMVKCCTCSTVKHWKEMDCGHFMSRKYMSTRYDEDNCSTQCKSCNVFRYGEAYLFSKFLGSRLSEKLYKKSRKTKKYANVDLEEMIEIYKKKVELLDNK